MTKETLAQQEQPAQKVSESWTDIVAVNLVREGVNKHKARELAAHFLTLFAPHTQPALTLDKLIDMAVDANLGRRMRPIMWKAGDVFYTDASYRTDELEVFARAIEAHCRGGATS